MSNLTQNESSIKLIDGVLIFSNILSIIIGSVLFIIWGEWKIIPFLIIFALVHYLTFTWILRLSGFLFGSLVIAFSKIRYLKLFSHIFLFLSNLFTILYLISIYIGAFYIALNKTSEPHIFSALLISFGVISNLINQRYYHDRIKLDSSAIIIVFSTQFIFIISAIISIFNFEYQIFLILLLIGTVISSLILTKSKLKTIDWLN